MHKQLSAITCLVCGLASSAYGVTIDWTTIGNPGNPSQLSGKSASGGGGPDINVGEVDYSYRIGTYEVTNSQYTEFLNAKDSSGQNTLNLYNGGMSTDPFNGGIAFNATMPAGQKYSVIAGHANQPVTYVMWYSTIRFANWLNNGQGNASTETGAYTLGPLLAGGIPINGNSIVRNSGAQVFLPSESEWYKAAYYNPATNSYFRFPTSSNTLPSPQPPPGDSNSANYVPGGWPNPDYNLSVGHLTDVGAYGSSISPYGTYGQGGNALEWTEALIQSDIGLTRGLRGGSFGEVWDHMLGAYRESATPKFGWYKDGGFRVAAVQLPEPSAMVLACLGGVSLLFWRRRNRAAL
jgi:formylglycine-generating enzyme required for sulfatase activity